MSCFFIYRRRSQTQILSICYACRYSKFRLNLPAAERHCNEPRVVLWNFEGFFVAQSPIARCKLNIYAQRHLLLAIALKYKILFAPIGRFRLAVFFIKRENIADSTTIFSPIHQCQGFICPLSSSSDSKVQESSCPALRPSRQRDPQGSQRPCY